MKIDAEYDSAIPIIENWLKTQLHLPQNIDHIILKRFIYSCQGDVEKTKALIDLNYTMRTNYSNIFLQRDPCSDEAVKVLQTTDMLILPGVTPSGNKLLFYRLVDLNPENFAFTESIKMFFMFADLRFIVPDPNGISSGEVPIFDMAGFSLKHLTRVVMSSLRVYMKFTQEAHPVRLKEIHVINCPSYLDKVLMIVKPFIKSEVFKLVKFHIPDSDTFYKYVPKEMLPNEYGGVAGDIKSIKEKWIALLKDYRHYLSNEKNWKVNEQLRKSSKNTTFVDSFKTLEID
ncbi:alpha-tocopherol transfer protein-like [Condylostylus longicornis]|uniref:alpha-tocopherol transfer protein-like n=1 Tax=Condylostylus longicornis TaxID=2530218 RepID=UPI00244DA91B|nr:alpha-tocopherol transfer protein-like [Condylostylus longicornis]